MKSWSKELRVRVRVRVLGLRGLVFRVRVINILPV